MENLNAETVKKMILNGAQRVVENEAYLCELDSFVGDGDHGVTAARGFTKVCEALAGQEYEQVEAVLGDTGKALAESMGGAIGPIMGSVFLGAAKEATDKKELSIVEFAQVLRAGCENVKKVGGAKRGDRTLVDSLEPAVEAAEQGGASVEEMLEACAQNARKGAEETKNMIARKGRARFLGEKSMGHQDAGATTFAIFIEGMANAI